MRLRRADLFAFSLWLWGGEDLRFDENQESEVIAL